MTLFVDSIKTHLSCLFSSLEAERFGELRPARRPLRLDDLQDHVLAVQAHVDVLAVAVVVVLAVPLGDHRLALRILGSVRYGVRSSQLHTTSSRPKVRY